MRILLSTYGSRGDVEPLAALAAQLQGLGAEAVVSAPPDAEFADLLERAGVPLAPAFMPVRQWIAEKAKPSRPADFEALTGEMIARQYDTIGAAAEGCDAVLGTGLMPSAAAAQCVAEMRGLPYFHASFCPLFLPSHHHRPFEYPGRPYPAGVTGNRALWELNIETMNALFGGAINTHRASIGLERSSNVRRLVFTGRPLLAADPALSPWEETDLCGAVQTGGWILRDERPLPADLEAFLEAGEPPVYVGFGSIAVRAGQDMAHVATGAIRAAGRRIVLARGWAGLAPVDSGDDCFPIGEINQQALFPRMAAVLHHGGGGTTAAAARAGAPQIIAPQIVDQPYWAGRVQALGAGVAHDGAAPTAESLSAALKAALSPEIRAGAARLAAEMHDGGAAAAAALILETVEAVNARRA